MPPRMIDPGAFLKFANAHGLSLEPYPREYQTPENDLCQRIWSRRFAVYQRDKVFRFSLHRGDCENHGAWSEAFANEYIYVHKAEEPKTR
jgi:hypothetical protein